MQCVSSTSETGFPRRRHAPCMSGPASEGTPSPAATETHVATERCQLSSKDPAPTRQRAPRVRRDAARCPRVSWWWQRVAFGPVLLLDGSRSPATTSLCCTIRTISGAKAHTLRELLACDLQHTRLCISPQPMKSRHQIIARHRTLLSFGHGVSHRLLNLGRHGPALSKCRVRDVRLQWRGSCMHQRRATAPPVRDDSGCDLKGERRLPLDVCIAGVDEVVLTRGRSSPAPSQPRETHAHSDSWLGNLSVTMRPFGPPRLHQVTVQRW